MMSSFGSDENRIATSVAVRVSSYEGVTPLERKIGSFRVSAILPYH